MFQKAGQLASDQNLLRYDILNIYTYLSIYLAIHIYIYVHFMIYIVKFVYFCLCLFISGVTARLPPCLVPLCPGVCVPASSS